MGNIVQANVVEALACAERTSTVTGSAVDVREYEGKGQVILMSSAATAGTSPTLDVKLQDSTTSGGSYSDVTGATFTQVTDAADSTEMIPIDFDASDGFIKVVGTIGGTSTPTFQFGVAIIGQKKSGRNSSQAV